MLDLLGLSSVEELLGAFPDELRLKGPLDLPRGLSEQALLAELKEIAGRNATVEDHASFLGAGAYNHYTPAAVGHILSRSEFNTSYTPYQPEVSQGTLQAIFEYQTLICQLTGMEAANASLYDGASAAAEAALMARRVTRGKRKRKRKKILLSSALHPEYRETVRTYLRSTGEEVRELPYCAKSGIMPPGAAGEAVDEDTACLVVQHPNFFGSLEEVDELAEAVHKKGGLLVVVVTEPLSLGILKPPGEMGADIVVGEGQSFGNALGFGGPYLGFMATKDEYLRQMPGRVVGRTKDRLGKRAFCLTLATREQHIRRERATSNICTNQGLAALAAAVYLACLGKGGLMDLARLNLSKAEYLKEKLSKLKGVKTAFNAPTFNEFVIELDGEVEAVLDRLLEEKIIGGLPLGGFYPELSNHLLLAATEMNTKEDMYRLTEGVATLVGR